MSRETGINSKKKKAKMEDGLQGVRDLHEMGGVYNVRSTYHSTYMLWTLDSSVIVPLRAAWRVVPW